MSEELIALQDTATQARANADELKAALTDQSSDEERTVADQAEQAAGDAETAFADAKAKADADTQPKAGDVCTLPDNTEGVLVEQDGNLVCASKEKCADDPDASRTGIVTGAARTGDPCVCPDGRPGTINVFAGGLAICLPNQG